MAAAGRSRIPTGVCGNSRESPHALTHIARGPHLQPSNIAHYCTRTHTLSDRRAAVRGRWTKRTNVNKLAEQPMRHPSKRHGERSGHSIREGDGRKLELGRGRGGGRRWGALPAGHVGRAGSRTAPPTAAARPPLPSIPCLRPRRRSLAVAAVRAAARGFDHACSKPSSAMVPPCPRRPMAVACNGSHVEHPRSCSFRGLFACVLSWVEIFSKLFF